MPYAPGEAVGFIRRGPTSDPRTVALITQDQIVALGTSPPAGVILAEGAPLSHAAIRLLALGVPVVIVDTRQAAGLRENARVRLDGGSGTVKYETDGPPPRTAPPPPRPGAPVMTADGHRVCVRASVGNPDAAGRALRFGAERVGLVRTELLGPEDGSLPDTGFYLATLERLCANAAPLAVNLRLMDTAPDKRPGWMPAGAGAASALGPQGSRLFGTEPIRSVVEAQLDAVNRLAGRHELGLIIPYLTRREELEHWASWVHRRLDAAVPLGAMIETPAAALDLSPWPECADFAAIGCNDLMQCLFAADRDIPALRPYLDPYAPPLYRFLRDLAGRAGERIDRLQLCGVLPQLAGVLPVLAGLGYRAFSVDPPLIPWLAERVAGLSVPACRGLAAAVCEARDTREVLDLLGVAAPFARPFAL
jgi:phosphoenolpyruvate-protein kinase (PTS system EI component)